MAEKSIARQTAPESSSLSLVEPRTLLDRVNSIQERIARRAFEIFENDGSWGRDLENWFKAEAEILHPAHLSVTEYDGMVNVQAEVPGFDAKELDVNVEAGRLTIAGRKEKKREDKDKGKTVYHETCSSEILRVIDLPASVDAAKTTAILKNGVLSLAMPKDAQGKAAKIEIKAA